MDKILTNLANFYSRKDINKYYKVGLAILLLCVILIVNNILNFSTNFRHSNNIELIKNIEEIKNKYCLSSDINNQLHQIEKEIINQQTIPNLILSKIEGINSSSALPDSTFISGVPGYGILSMSTTNEINSSLAYIYSGVLFYICGLAMLIIIPVTSNTTVKEGIGIGVITLFLFVLIGFLFGVIGNAIPTICDKPWINYILYSIFQIFAFIKTVSFFSKYDENSK